MTYTLPKVSLRVVRENPLVATEPITDLYAAVRLIRDFLRDMDKEVFAVMSLDTRNHPLNISVVHIGSIGTCPVSTKDVFKTALASNARSIICFHNHPGGYAYPSPEDVEVTHKLVEAGKLMDTPVADHIIVSADGTYFSFAEEGILE